MSCRPLLVLAALAALCLSTLAGVAAAKEPDKARAATAKTANLSVQGCPGGSLRSAACLDANKGDVKACACEPQGGDAPAAAGTLDAVGAQASKWAPTGALAPAKAAAPVTPPAPGARKLKSGTIKLACPAGTDKLCKGNDCGCWTRKE